MWYKPEQKLVSYRQAGLGTQGNNLDGIDGEVTVWPAASGSHL
jgi:hypothetical protein